MNAFIPERPIFFNCREDFTLLRFSKNHNRSSLEKKRKGEVNVSVSVYENMKCLILIKWYINVVFFFLFNC